MRWDTVLFDLDGTVTDSQEGIVNSVSYALKRLGREVPSPDMLTTFVGPPLHESFPALCGMNEEETERAIREFRIYFERYGWAENAPYAGMAELLASLCAAGLRLVIATSKPEEFARRVLRHFELAQYFDDICGSRLEDKSSADKASVVRTALMRADVTGHAVMVGDRRHDIYGAHANGLEAIGGDVSLEDIARLADVFYCGGTKCGALFGEAVVIVNDELKPHFRANMKQNGAMLAKGWLLGAQFEALFTDDLYFKVARRANEYAARVKDACAKAGIPLFAQTTTNQVFINFTDAQYAQISEQFELEFEQRTDEEHVAIRVCTSWATREEEIVALEEAIAAL